MPAPASLDPSRIKDICALDIGRVGDLITAGPFLRSLRTRFPEARIRLVTSSGAVEAARLLPGPDEILAAHRVSSPLQNLKLAARLLTGSCDLLVDLNPSFSRLSAALALAVRAPLKLAFEKGRFDRLYNLRAAAPGEREHMLDRYARLAKILEAPFDPTLQIRVSAEDDVRAERLLSPADGRRRVLIHPGNFKKFDNRWPEEKFVELTELLLKDSGLQVLYMSGPGEEEHVRSLVSRLTKKTLILPVSPLAVTAAMMRRMDLCVLNITGTTHLAAAVGAPTFGLYSGYTDAVWRLRGPLHSGVVSDEWESCRSITVETARRGLQAKLAELKKGL